MTLVFAVLAIVVLGLVVAVALGRIGGGLDAPTSSLPPTGLPDGDLVAGDLEHIRFAPALRGYRMDQVDAVLDRLIEEIARRDAELEHLRRMTPIDTAGFGIPLDTLLRGPSPDASVHRDARPEQAGSEDLFTPHSRSGVPPVEG